MAKDELNQKGWRDAFEYAPTIVVLDDFHRVFERSPEFRALGPL